MKETEKQNFNVNIAQRLNQSANRRINSVQEGYRALARAIIFQAEKDRRSQAAYDKNAAFYRRDAELFLTCKNGRAAADREDLHFLGYGR